ncbi:hypothetical protein FBU30_010947 [Linnemannia zychae]|nr:hypothetical protein FBU30_010947 [Linnemannia zychae]
MTGSLDQDTNLYNSSPSSSLASTFDDDIKTTHEEQDIVVISRHVSREVLANHNLNINGGDSPATQEPQSRGSRIRWAILGSACLVLFGNYYAFDNPAALNQPLKEYMQLSDDAYAYFLNILYTSYSLPNIVLPWLGGYASDIFGHRRLVILLSATVAMGHLVVCLGVESRSVPAMVIGRVIFGAGESLAVAQSAITVNVLNDILTPYIWSRSSVPIAFWGGFVSCILSFFTACVLAWLDRRYESTVTGGFSLVSTHSADGRFSFETSDIGAIQRYDPPTATPSRSRKIDSSEVVGMELLDSSGESLRRNRRLQDSNPLEEGNIASGHESDSSHDSIDHRNSQDVMVQGRATSGDSNRNMGRTRHSKLTSLNQQCLRVLKPVFDYTQSSWVFFLMTLLMVGVQVPFNSIHAGFLQMRWYHNDPQKAAQIMTVPDLLSAILVLPVGYFVDHYGQKSWLFMMCGLTIGFSHFVLGIIPIPSPVPALIALGVATAIGAVFNSAIPALVKPYQIATA